MEAINKLNPNKVPLVGEVWDIPLQGGGYTEVTILKITAGDHDQIVHYVFKSGKQGRVTLDVWLSYVERGTYKFLRYIESGPIESGPIENGPTEETTGEGEQIKHRHYFKPVTGYAYIDIYRVLRMWGVVDHEIGHAVKKLLNAGQRGAKDKRQDIKEAIDTLQRMVEILDEDEDEALADQKENP